MKLGGFGFNGEQPIIVGGNHSKGADFQRLFILFFCRRSAHGVSDLLKWRLTFVDKKCGIIVSLGGISVYWA